MTAHSHDAINGAEMDGKPYTPPAKSRQSTQHEELQYLNLIRQILDEGEHRPDR